MFLLGMFTMYVANYFIIVFFNVALVGVANSRLMGGTWTFRDGLELAWARKGTILQWALVAATVGVILRTLEERMGLIGRLIMRIIGVAWTLGVEAVLDHREAELQEPGRRGGEEVEEPDGFVAERVVAPQAVGHAGAVRAPRGEVRQDRHGCLAPGPVERQPGDVGGVGLASGPGLVGSDGRRVRI